MEVALDWLVYLFPGWWYRHSQRNGETAQENQQVGSEQGRVVCETGEVGFERKRGSVFSLEVEGQGKQ